MLNRQKGKIVNFIFHLTLLPPAGGFLYVQSKTIINAKEWNVNEEEKVLQK